MPKVKRVDAIQSFVSQETPIVRITDIGRRDRRRLQLHDRHRRPLRDRRFSRAPSRPALIGRDAGEVERIWRDLLFLTHATTVGAITALAQAAIDTALWDLRCRKAGLPLHVMAGGAQNKVRLYTTEGGWLHLPTEALVEDALRAKAAGFGGAKMKVGRPQCTRTSRGWRRCAQRVGDGFEIFTDANQAFAVDEAIRRARRYEPFDIGWLEEPLAGRRSRRPCPPVRNRLLCRSPSARASTAFCISANICSAAPARWCRPTWRASAASRPGSRWRIWPRAFNMPVCPHFLMELHVALCCAVPNARWVEYIPQLDSLTEHGMTIEEGYALPSETPGLGIAWDWAAIERQRVPEADHASSSIDSPRRPRCAAWACVSASRPSRWRSTSGLHAAVWPDVLAMISACNIRNYSIYLKEPENILFGYWEYHGADFAADAANMAADPATQRWWSICMPCQEPLRRHASRANGGR